MTNTTLPAFNAADARLKLAQSLPANPTTFERNAYLTALDMINVREQDEDVESNDHRDGCECGDCDDFYADDAFDA